jgi:hypothetical protein
MNRIEQNAHNPALSQRPSRHFSDRTPFHFLLSYTKATIIEPQPHVTWADGSIHLTVNLGKLSGGTAYVFVFDASNARSAVGLPVSVGP